MLPRCVFSYTFGTSFREFFDIFDSIFFALIQQPEVRFIREIFSSSHLSLSTFARFLLLALDINSDSKLKSQSLNYV